MGGFVSFLVCVFVVWLGFLSAAACFLLCKQAAASFASSLSSSSSHIPRLPERSQLVNEKIKERSHERNPDSLFACLNAKERYNEWPLHAVAAIGLLPFVFRPGQGIIQDIVNIRTSHETCLCGIEI